MTRGMRTTSVFVGAGALLVSAAVWGVLMFRADAKHDRSVGDPADYGPLTDRQYAAAVRVAQHELDRQKPSRLVSATAVLKPGKVRQPNLADACHSGEVVRIRLVGRFPRITVSPPPGGTSGPVTLVGITADATNGRACLLGVGVGRSAPYGDAADLLPALHR